MINPLSLVQKLVGDTTFGIMDLLRPTAKRTQRFVSVLQNFWLFCNQRVAETDAVQVTLVYCTLLAQLCSLHAAGECGRPGQ